MNAFYVYVLFRPWDASPCYVGKGKGKRWLDHERAGGNHPNKHLANILIKARRLGLEIPKIKVRENLLEDEAIITEIALIAAIGRGRSGSLVNLTDGGDGVSGRLVTEEERVHKRVLYTGKRLSHEHRKAISDAQKGKKYTLGHKLSVEHRAKIGKAAKGNKHNLGRKQSTLTRAKISASLKGLVRSIDTRARMSAAQKASALRRIGRINADEFNADAI